MSITDLAKSWGGFEKLVAKLHETGDVSVRHGVTLMGKSGAPRQIDVLISHRKGLHDYLVIAECKYWKTHVKRLHVDALATTMRETGAKGVIFSTKGFQKGAITQAAHEHISLYKVRDLTDDEWGLPGRVVDFYIHVNQPSFGNIQFPDLALVSNQPITLPLNVELQFDDKGPTSSHLTVKKDGSDGPSIESYLWDAIQKILSDLMQLSFIINGGEECTRYITRPVNLVPDRPFLIKVGDTVMIAPLIKFTVAMKIDQRRITVDRAKNYKFALAVEDCVTGITSSASQRNLSDTTELISIIKESHGDNLDVITNGSVMSMLVSAPFQFSELDNLTAIEFKPISVDNKE